MEKYDNYKKWIKRIGISLLLMDFILGIIFQQYLSSSFSIIFIGGFLYKTVEEYAKHKVHKARFPKEFFIVFAVILVLGLHDITRNLVEFL